MTPEDAPALLALAEAIGFGERERSELREVWSAYFAGVLGRDHRWLVDDDRGPVGVAYYAPERMTEGTWNLYMIAVHPDRQREGRGAALVAHVERTLAESGQRLLLVETSGTDDFAHAWAFYRRCGFEREARIRDFYKPGDDKLVYRKTITPIPAS